MSKKILDSRSDFVYFLNRKAMCRIAYMIRTEQSLKYKEQQEDTNA